VTNGTVTDSSATPVTLGTFSVSGATGGTYVGSPQITWAECTLPIQIAGTVSVNSAALTQSVSAQHSLGAKSNSGDPVCYQVSVFNNDAGSDNDWNDLVLNFQLYNASTD
jgi:hypothetical protein